MEYEIGKHSRHCFVTGRELQAGQEFVSALLDTPAGLLRRDYASEAWPGPPEGTIGFWRGRIRAVESAPKAAPIDTASMTALFEQLQQAQDAATPGQEKLRYVVALWLIRRKALKLQSITHDESGDYLVVRRPRAAATYVVKDLQLAEDELRETEEQLRGLLAQSVVGDHRP